MPAPEIAGSSLGQGSGPTPMGPFGFDGLWPCGSEIVSPTVSKVMGVASMYLKNSYVDQQMAVDGIW